MCITKNKGMNQLCAPVAVKGSSVYAGMRGMRRPHSFLSILRKMNIIRLDTISTLQK